MAFAKVFAVKLLRDFSLREAARRVLDKSFETSLNVVKESLEEYSSPEVFRGNHNEMEAIQRLNLYTAMPNGRHLLWLWLIERMIELRATDTVVKEWSEAATFTANLQRAFRVDAWRNILHGLPSFVLRCTCKLANAFVAGLFWHLDRSRLHVTFQRSTYPTLITYFNAATNMPFLRFLLCDFTTRERLSGTSLLHKVLQLTISLAV